MLSLFYQSVLIENSSLFLNNSSVAEVLYAAAWICGEFAEYVILLNDIIILYLIMVNYF